MADIIITAQKGFDKRQNAAFRNVVFTMNEDMKKSLRRQFDNSHIDFTRLAVIDAAQEEGFDDLVEELKNDFYVVTGREAKDVR